VAFTEINQVILIKNGRTGVMDELKRKSFFVITRELLAIRAFLIFFKKSIIDRFWLFCFLV
jgi:hypothetical protein